MRLHDGPTLGGIGSPVVICVGSQHEPVVPFTALQLCCFSFIPTFSFGVGSFKGTNGFCISDTWLELGRHRRWSVLYTVETIDLSLRSIFFCNFYFLSLLFFKFFDSVLTGLAWSIYQPKRVG